MNHPCKFLKELWYRSAGLSPPEEKPLGTMPPFESLVETEWSPEFERHMRARLIMGAFRHGLLHDPTKPNYDRCGNAKLRITKYQETGNLEFLVDAANMLLLEYEEGTHPNRHFRSKDEHEFHCGIQNEQRIKK